MASKTKRSNGHYWIFTKRIAGKRSTLRLGQITDKQAEAIFRKVCELEDSVAFGLEPSAEIRLWLQSIPDELHQKIAQAKLTSPRVGTNLKEFLDRWIESLNVKASTKGILGVCKRNLIDYFGGDTRIKSITAGMADEFRTWLTASGRTKGNKPLSIATVSRRIGLVKQAFLFAQRSKWIDENPFGHFRGRHETNPAREVYVTRELVEALLDQITDPELRLMLALGRYAGLRHPSEVINLPTAAIRWEFQVIRVASPKTEHHPDGQSRDVPIFEELFPTLNEYWENHVAEGQELLFPRRAQLTETSATKALEVACRQIGVPLWVRPWNNMRASCETDWLRAGHIIFETSAWMGHSPDVALKHYNRVAKELSPVETADLPSALRPALRSFRSHPGAAQTRAIRRASAGLSETREG